MSNNTHEISVMFNMNDIQKVSATGKTVAEAVAEAMELAGIRDTNIVQKDENGVWKAVNGGKLIMGMTDQGTFQAKATDPAEKYTLGVAVDAKRDNG